MLGRLKWVACRTVRSRRNYLCAFSSFTSSDCTQDPEPHDSFCTSDVLAQLLLDLRPQAAASGPGGLAPSVRIIATAEDSAKISPVLRQVVGEPQEFVRLICCVCATSVAQNNRPGPSGNPVVGPCTLLVLLATCHYAKCRCRLACWTINCDS